MNAFFVHEFSFNLFSILYWIVCNWIEIFATISGLVYLIYSVQGNKLLWPYGIITSALYIYVFLKAGVYADMAINVYYVVISIYGWYFWTFGRRNNHTELPVRKVDRVLALVLLLATIIIFVSIAFILQTYTDSDIAYWDAFTTSASIVGTWMLARKLLEHWLVWILVDAISVGLYIYKGLYPTVFLFTVYTVLAFMGYFEWKKLLLCQKAER